MLQSTPMQQSSLSSAQVTFMILLAGTFSLVGCRSESPEEATTTPPAAAVPENEEVAFQDEEGPDGVRNYTRVDATVACAGATPPEAMAELRNRGFTTVINFRTAGERGATTNAGQEAAEAAGLRYIHLPFREPTAELAESFLEAVADPANQPVYIHCGSANRVGAMWLIKRVKQDGYAVDDALAEAEAIGLSSAALREFALDYVGGAGN